MDRHPSAIKRHRQSLKRREKNRSVRSTVKTYIKKVETENGKDRYEETLLMGPIYYYILANKGPFYQLPKGQADTVETALFEHCIQNFDDLFRDASDFTVFLWNDERVEVRKDVMEKVWI